jgi:pimeloyl-ACP methyl ester carboxylesterase
MSRFLPHWYNLTYMDRDSLQVNGLNVTFSVEGRGSDVLFVHGWAASRRMWAHLTSELSAQYRCWAIDLPGCGDSDKPANGWYSIPNFTATVREFMRAHGLHRVRLVGHSMGGMIALNLAARHPDVVERLVAINPVVTGRANLRPLARPDHVRRVLDWALRLSPLVLQPLWSDAIGGRPSLHHIRRRTQDFAKGTADSLLSSGRAVVSYDVSPLLKAVTAPTLVILGDKDLNVPCSEGLLAAECIPCASVHRLPAGHMTTDDRPAEVVQQLQRFLA